MKNIRSRDDFDKAIQSLVGLTLRTVHYYECSQSGELPPVPCYESTLSDFAHCLDFGVQFQFQDGSIQTLMWSGDFESYGIGIYPHEARLELAGFQEWNVTDVPEWEPLIGVPICDAKVYWGGVTVSEGGSIEREGTYPQDLWIQFANGQDVYFSACYYNPDDEILEPMGDSTWVIFDPALAKKQRRGPYAHLQSGEIEFRVNEKSVVDRRTKWGGILSVLRWLTNSGTS